MSISLAYLSQLQLMLKIY